MASEETKKLISLVTEKTGYGVSIDSAPEITTYATMISGSRNNPRHLIRINPKYHQHGDYLVALQCAMLLIKWADSTKVPSFVLRDERITELAAQLDKPEEWGSLSSSLVQQHSQMITRGLLHQLQSMPAEMMAMDMCYELCPSLRDLQMSTVRTALRDITAVLAPHTRDQTPSQVFTRNAVMNAAFVLNWCRKSNDETGLIPFRAMGYVAQGQKLLDAYLAIPVTVQDRYVRTVDEWAVILEMVGWYEWQFRNEERAAHGSNKD